MCSGSTVPGKSTTSSGNNASSIVFVDIHAPLSFSNSSRQPYATPHYKHTTPHVTLRLSNHCEYSNAILHFRQGRRLAPKKVLRPTRKALTNTISMRYCATQALLTTHTV